MGRSRGLAAVVSNLLLVAGLAAIWVGFAPVKFGGQVSYIMVNGISMEPNYHRGDLVLVRKAADYRVGDIVTYYYPELSSNVIHRIIGVKNDRFVMKGDNNSWIDGYEPTRSDVLGKFWLYLPKMAKIVAWIHTPINLALSTALLGGLVMTSMSAPKQKKQSGRNTTGGPSGHPGGVFEIGLYVFGGLALVCLGLGILVFTRPLMRAADKLTYTQTGTFDYTAAGDSQVYDSGAAHAGDPIFLKLTCSINLAFTYQLQGQQLQDIAGRQQFYAILRDEQTGWQRTFPILADTTFTDSTFSSKASLDLCKLEDLISSVGSATGVHAGSNTLIISQHISIGGKISGQEFTDKFEPQLNFEFDGLKFYLLKNSDQPNPMQTVKAGSLVNPGQVENTFSLFGLKLPIRQMRTWTGIGMGISLAGLLVLGLFYMRVTGRSQETAIRMKYGAQLVDIYDLGLETLDPVVEITSMEDLAKLAERLNVMIMHFQREYLHIYLVQSGGMTYRYGFEEKTSLTQTDAPTS